MPTFSKIKFGDGLDVTDEGAGVIEVNAAAGVEGPPGPAGATGPAGPTGPATFISGTGAPTAGTGVDGAFYLDTATGKIYGPKAAGAWPATATGRLVMPGNTYNDVFATYSNYAALLAG